MERTKLLTLAVVGLLLLNLLTVGFLILKPNRPPHPEHPPGQSGIEGPAALIIERLHFDLTQQQAYRQLVKQHQNQTRILNDQMAQLYRAYYGLLASTQPDSAQAIALSQQIADSQLDQTKLNFAHFGQIKALCHPDQQADFERLVSDLSRLFSHQQRSPRFGADGPPEGRPEGPPENFPPRP